MALGTARVARPFLGLRAVPRDVATLVAVVALGALHAVTREMTDASAGVAGLAPSSTERVVTSISIAESATASSAKASSSSRLGARTRDVPDLAALVAFRPARARSGSHSVAKGTTASTTRLGRRVGAVAGDVTLLPALVAGLRLLLVRAVAGEMALLAAVVASRGTGLRALRSKMAEAATVKASTSGHFSGSGLFGV